MEDLSWIICEGSRSSDKCPNKGEREGEFSEEREEGRDIVEKAGEASVRKAKRAVSRS